MPRKSKEAKAKAAEVQAAKRKEFRFEGKKVMLTYSNCPTLTRERIRDAIKAKIPETIWWIVGQEKHEDGSPHFHAVFRFNKTIETLDKKKFDVDDVHPHISAVKNKQSLKRVYEYCRKDNNFIIHSEPDIFTGSKDFRKDMGDHTAWILYRASRNKIDPWPVTLPCGKTMERPSAADKRRNRYYVAPSNWGKTKWLNSLGPAKYFLVTVADELCFEGYNNEELVIFDDCYPSLEMLRALSDVYDHIHVKMPGKQRYAAVMRDPGRVITVIILKFDLPPYATDMESDKKIAFDNRYQVVHLTENSQDQNVNEQPEPEAASDDVLQNIIL